MKEEGFNLQIMFNSKSLGHAEGGMDPLSGPWLGGGPSLQPWQGGCR